MQAPRCIRQIDPRRLRGTLTGVELDVDGARRMLPSLTSSFGSGPICVLREVRRYDIYVSVVSKR